ncbi:MAG: hypothetical protein IKJ35_03295 [Clostridia bacterium]|nr:hypothetical protein [Clostridia bacterium]
MSDYRTPRIVGKVIKTSLALFVLFINAIVIWRVFFSASIPKTIRTLEVNQALAEAYAAHGDALILQNQDQLSLTYAEDNAGYFGIPEYVIIPQANQVQIVFRYNNSTLRHLAEDYGLSEIPEKSLEWFDVTLVKTTDLTPDNREDDLTPETLSRERIQPSSRTRKETSLYTYYRFVFDGVTLEPDTRGILVDVYYLGDLDYDKEAYGTLCLYDDQSVWFDYELTSADKKALRATVGK